MSARKSRKSHCGIRAMNFVVIGRCEKFAISMRVSPNCAKMPCHFLMRQLQEVLKPAELFHHSQRRGMDRVAAKIAEEILVLLEHRYLDAGACQKHAKHHSRWATARNATRDPLIHDDQLRLKCRPCEAVRRRELSFRSELGDAIRYCRPCALRVRARHMFRAAN